MSSDPIEVLRALRGKIGLDERGPFLPCGRVTPDSTASVDAALDTALASLSAPKPSSVNDNAVAVNESAPVNDKPESAMAAFKAEAEAQKARAERLAEALRELEEREQRDEALLRQALGRAHQTAMEQTLKARTPECAEFAGIAQDLDFVVAALRERLGVKA